MNDSKGLVFNIQRFSIQDGPGIRTTVFFKGCNLHCRWCHNPESQLTAPQIQFFSNLCLNCGQCLSVCPQGSRTRQDGIIQFDRSLCQACGLCAGVCPTGALSLCGQWQTADAVLAEVGRDEPFYRQSGGGLTLSGGEPLLQLGFAVALLQGGKNRQWHTAVDTAGHVAWDRFAAVLPFTDLFLYDLKSMDPDRHRLATGVDNRLILANLTRLGQLETTIHVRMPLIAGFNDSLGEMEQAADFLRRLPAVAWIELSPYHGLAGGKYQSLGQQHDITDESPSDSHLEAVMAIFRQRGLAVRLLNG